MALKFRRMTVAIRGAIIFSVTIRGLITAVCHGQRYTFERFLPQQNEIQFQPFYIGSPLVRGALSFSCTTLQM
jgi:hypothetical protein